MKVEDAKKPTYKNIEKIGKFICESTWGGMNEIIPAEVYKYENDFYKKCFQSWTRRGHLQKLDECQALQYNA